MPKVEIKKVAEILKKNPALTPGALRQLIEELQLLAAPADGAERTPAVKKQFAILISDPDRRLPERADFVGWVLQLPEDESVATVCERIHRAAYDFNASKKGRLHPAKTLGEAIEYVPASFFKEADLWVKTKTPVLMLCTDNEIPGVDAAQLRIPGVGPAPVPEAPAAVEAPAA